MDTLSFSSGNGLIKLANVAAAAQSGFLLTTSSSCNDIKLTTAMVQRTVSEVSSDSSQSLSTLDSRSSSQSDSGCESQVLSVQSTSGVKVKPGRKSKSAPEEDPRQKKVRSLERNRAAAMRCREKRKLAIKALEANADEMQKLNDRLQGEVAILRKKVTELKTALLAHKDCPVTLQLKKKDEQCFPIMLHS